MQVCVYVELKPVASHQTRRCYCVGFLMPSILLLFLRSFNNCIIYTYFNIYLFGISAALCVVCVHISGELGLEAGTRHVAAVSLLTC